MLHTHTHNTVRSADQIPLLVRLLNRGITFPPPPTVHEAELVTQLWRLIHALAELDVYLQSTNHLSDRELYEKLWADVLGSLVDADMGPETAWYFDMCGHSNLEERDTYLRYYANDTVRASYVEEYPGLTLPERVTTHHDRDTQLPDLAYNEKTAIIEPH